MPSSPYASCPSCAREYASGETFCSVDGARLLPGTGMGFGSSEGPDPLLNQVLSGRYRVLRKIGEGGMGIVYEAVHEMIEKSVALKVLRADFSHREDVVERFRQEAKSASRIGHQHIIDISDFGVTDEGSHFFVMELLLGRDLAEELELRGPLSTRRAVEIVLQCAKALEAAHGKGIVHRDMKPENIFLVQRDTGEDFIKIVDFGIAKMSDVDTGEPLPGRKITRSGMIFGTPEYMSPEHAAGRELDHRVDIYALGVILYELLTGRVPFMGDTFMGILTQHMFEAPPPLRTAYAHCSAPPELEQLLLRCMAKRPGQRPQSMGELAAALAELLPELGPAAVSLPPPGTFTHIDQPPVSAYGSGFSRTPITMQPFASPALGRAAPRRRRRLGWWLATGLSFSLAATAALVALRLGPFTQTATRLAVVPPVPPAPIHVVPTPSLVTRVEPLAQPTPAPSPRLVEVEVVSSPDGASVVVDGQRVCRATPCRFQAQRGAAIQVAVQKDGYRSGRTELSPDRELNHLELTLSRRRGGAPGGNRMDGDLMLPDAFGKR